MKAISLYPLNEKAIQELAELYRTTKDVRLRTRAADGPTIGRTGLGCW